MFTPCLESEFDVIYENDKLIIKYVTLDFEIFEVALVDDISKHNIQRKNRNLQTNFVLHSVENRQDIGYEKFKTLRIDYSFEIFLK